MGVKFIYPIQNPVFLTILLMTVLFINISKSQATPSFPSLYMNTSTTISTPIQIYGNIKQIKIQGGFIFRLSMTGKLMIWSAKKRNLLYKLFDGQSQYPLQKCVKFSLDSNNETLAIYTASQKVLILIIKISGTINPTLISQFTPQYNISNSTAFVFRNIEIINNIQLVIFLSLSEVKSLIQRFTLNGTSIGQQNKIVSANIQSLYQMTVCGVGYGTNKNGSFMYYVAVWKDDCYFQLQSCLVGGQCLLVKEYKATACVQADFSSNLTTNFKLKFAQKCSAIIFSSRSQGYGVYNINDQQFTSFFSNTINVELSLLHPLKAYIYGLIFHFTYNGMFFINQYSPTIQSNVIANLTLPQYGIYSALSIDNLYFLTANDSHMIFYPFYCEDSTLTLVPSSLCLRCPRYCQNCDLTSKCLQCRVNYTLYETNNSCMLSSGVVINNSNQINNVIIDNNSTINNTNINIGNDTTNSTTTVPENQQQQQPTNTNNITIQPKYSFQSTITNLIQSQSAQTVINASVFSLSMLQLFPFSFLFMRFINFWSICSYYLFLRVKMPTYLYDILYSIYQGINTSIFQSLGVDIGFKLTQQEKVDKWMNDEFGIEWDFVSANVENFILLVFSYLVLWLLYVIREKLDKTNIIRRGIQKINLPMAIIGQYVAIMNGFFMVIPVIQLHPHQLRFTQKSTSPFTQRSSSSLSQLSVMHFHTCIITAQE